MIEIIIFSIIALVLSFILIQRTYKKKNPVAITVIILMLIGIITMPYVYIYNKEITLFSRVVSYSLAIILPLSLISLEIIFKTSYDELVILLLSNILSFIGKKKAAKELLSKYTDKYENCYNLHRKLGKIYESEGGIRRSINEYIKAVDINRKDYDLYFRITQMMEFLDQKEETKELLVRLIGVYKKYPEAYLMFGEMLEEEEKYKDAVKVYSEGIKHNPDDFDLVYRLISTYLKINEFKAAQDKLEQVAIKYKKEYIVLINLGQLLLMSGEREESKKHFKKALKFKEIKDLALYELAKISVIQGDEKEAIDYLNYALEINFNIINRINKSEIFSNIREDVVTKMDAESRSEDHIPMIYMKTFDDLEEKLDLVLGLSANEKKDKTEYKVNSLIKDKGESLSVEELQERLLRTNEFIKENIESVEGNLSEYFNFSKGKHDKHFSEEEELKDFRLKLEDDSFFENSLDKNSKKLELKKKNEKSILKRVLKKTEPSDYSDNSNYSNDAFDLEDIEDSDQKRKEILDEIYGHQKSEAESSSIKDRIVNIHKETENNLEDLRKNLKKNLESVKISVNVLEKSEKNKQHNESNESNKSKELKEDKNNFTDLSKDFKNTEHVSIKEDKKYQLDKEKYIENLKTLRNMKKEKQKNVQSAQKVKNKNKDYKK